MSENTAFRERYTVLQGLARHQEACIRLTFGGSVSSEFRQDFIQLGPGDRLLLYTDGFTEAVLPDGSMLDEAGFLKLVLSIPDDSTGPDFHDVLYADIRQVAWQLTPRSPDLLC